VSSAFTVAEADHLILTRLGVAAELSFIDSLASGFLVPTLDPQGLRDARRLCARYREQQLLGIADASIVVLAAHFSTSYLATFDERHFRSVRPLDEDTGAFTLLPADAT
jgi:predicted nucleic acid-binding protein